MMKIFLVASLICAAFIPAAFAQETLFDKGLRQFKAQQYEEAIVSFQQVVSTSPENYAAFYNIGLCHYNLERYDRAVEAFRRSVAIKPDYVVAWVQMGNALDYLDNYSEAIGAYQRSRRLLLSRMGSWHRS